MGYGTCKYGTFKYAAASCFPSGSPGERPKAKADTVYYSFLTGSDWVAELQTDYSQYVTSLTDETSYLSSDDSRFFIMAGGERNISLRLNGATNDGTLVCFGDGAATDYKMALSSSAVVISENDEEISRLDLPAPEGLIDVDEFVVNWSVRPNGTSVTWNTGRVHELWITNGDLFTGSYAVAEAHTGSHGSSGIFTLGADSQGNDVFGGIQEIHVGTAYRGGGEFAIDWGSRATRTGLYSMRYQDPLTFSRDSGMADAGSYAGPAWTVTQNWINEQQTKTQGLIWQETFGDITALSDVFPANDLLWGNAPGHAGYKRHIRYLKRSKMAPGSPCTYAYFRMHVSSSMLNQGRMVSMNRELLTPDDFVGTDGPPPFETYSEDLIFLPGEQWVSGNLQIALDNPENETILYPCFVDTAVKVNHISVMPYQSASLLFI